MRKTAFLTAAAVLAFSAAHALPQAQPTAAPVTAAVAAQTGSAAATPAARAGAYTLDKAHAKVIWSTSHFGFSTYYGEFTDFDAKLNLDPVNPANSKLQVLVQTGSVNGHDEALEKHLRSADFFNVEKFPTANFVSTRVTPTGPTTADVTGNFTLLGVTKPLTLKVTFNKAGENMAKTYVAGFSAEGVIKRSDYGMNYGVPAVGDDVKITFSGEFNPAA